MLEPHFRQVVSMMAPKYIGAGIPAVKTMKASLEKHNCAL